MKFLENIPYAILLPAAVLLGAAPFVPEPHLFEKVRLLLNGQLVRSVDIFDLLLHATPIVLLALKLTLAGK